MKRRILICFLFLFLILEFPATVQAAQKERPPVDAREVILGHLKDSYHWHFFDIGERHISLPLPVIVHSKERGWFVFLSSRLEESGMYKGFSIAEEGRSAGKIVEKDGSGNQTRPFDISITKNVVSLFFTCILLIFLVLNLAKWYRKREEEGDPDAVPSGLNGIIEWVTMSIYEGVIIKCVGKDHKRYAPYLLTAFFFIFLTNLLGLVPIFPAGANLTGNIAITMSLALCTMIAINIFGNKEYWKEILWPDMPIFMKAPIPIMQIIEFFGILTKPMALMIRLFANIFAGHIIILALTSLVFLTVAKGTAINASMSAVSVLFSVFMMVLELLVAFIQAYVFTMLSSIFIGLSRKEPHKTAIPAGDIKINKK